MATVHAAALYHGNCHCGKFRFELTVPEILEAIVCACTLCAKKGYLWLRPAAGSLKVTRDDGCLTEYKAATLKDQVGLPISSQASSQPRRSATVHGTAVYTRVLTDTIHKFCNHCGTGVLGEHLTGSLRGQPLVNIRAIQGVNPFKLRCGILDHVSFVESTTHLDNLAGVTDTLR